MTDRDGIDFVTVAKIRKIGEEMDEHTGNLNSFEIKFMVSTLQKFGLYGSQMMMSVKQINIVNNIYDKLRS